MHNSTEALFGVLYPSSLKGRTNVSKLSLSDGLAVAGLVAMFVLVALDKAGKLKGPLPLILLGIAAVMTLPLALGNSWVIEAPSKTHQLFRGLMMFFVAGFVYSMFALWILPEGNQSESEGAAPSLDNTIVVECLDAVMPTLVPPTGMANTIHVNPNGGFGNRSGAPGEKWDWGTSTPPLRAFKCSIKNLGSVPVSDIRVMLRAVFLEELSSGSGQPKHSFDYRIVIPSLKAAGADEYVIYIYNIGIPFYADIQLPQSVTLRKIGDAGDIEVKVRAHQSTPGFPLRLTPVKMNIPAPNQDDRIAVLDLFKAAEGQGADLIGHRQRIAMFAQLLQQAGVDGKLKFSGRTALYNPLIPIAPEHWHQFRVYWWESVEIDMGNSGNMTGFKDSNKLMRSRTLGHKDGYLDLHVDRAQASDWLARNIDHIKQSP
jgi:hypothetical protein